MTALAHHADAATVVPASAERVELAVTPAVWAVLLLSIGWVAGVVVLAIGAFALAAWGILPRHYWMLAAIFVLLLLSVLVGALLICRSYSFELTQARVRTQGGVLARGSIEARLEHLQNVSVHKSFLQRAVGIGSLEMTTAGLGPPIVWWHVARPTQLAERVRRAIDEAHTRADHPPGRTHAPAPAAPRRFPVIGLAGGIGAGKSAVARSFELRGCHVIDSDARAKAALDRPDVRDSLVAWWGPSILDAEGRVDRAKVASIIFAEPGQRIRLEKLVHPIVREDRAHMIKEAKAAGARGVVVDAPLLFEAGVDSECDAVVFVDAPRELRVHRVAQSRGWDEQELDRREAAQLPLDEKRQRSQYVVENYGKLGSVDSQVGRILAQIEAQA